MNRAGLHEPMADGELALEPLAEAHREGLRACCRADDPVWEIYSVDLTGDAFDPGFAAMLGDPARHVFAVVCAGEVVGMTAFLHIVPARQTLELGGTFMAPQVRGSGLNARVKALMLGRAFACGVRRIEFRIDERNARSQRAVAKLGAVKEGTLRAERVTWTGHVRDTALWSILADEVTQ
ncbi:MAG: GNAT family N-acetyltransferase [Sphingomonadales bacterium]|nr:GNAT family N-acetyltransferase [Sphingomonadales bacterium]